MPDLMPTNISTLKIWQLVQDQRIWVSGGMGAPVSVALKHEPIWKLIDEFHIEDRIKTFSKILRVFDNIRSIEHQNSQMASTPKR